MTPFRLLWLVLFLFAAFPLHAQEVVTKALSDDEIALQDARVVRLAGIKGVAGAKAFLDATLTGKTILLQDPVIDRYGRLVATVLRQGEAQPVQDAMLRAGLAFVYPGVGEVDHQLALERAAREEKRGYWKDHADADARNAAALCGQYGFVSGVVVKAERIKNKVYLDFDPDRRSGFTLVIAAHFLRGMRKDGFDPLAAQGRRLRVRGWITREEGATIHLSDEHQMELLE